MDMMRGFIDKGYITIHHHNSFWIYFNWEHMLLHRRGIPQTLENNQLRNRGDICMMYNGPLECCKYLDSKPVYMLSTKHGSSLTTTSRRNPITNEIIRKPNVVTNYNKYMG